jgi:hypothetical protein
MQLQSFLREHSIEELERRFAITAKPHKTFPNLYLFKYNQLESPFAERIVQESRGVILDRENNWRVVARGYDKFFNAGEHLAASIDWPTAHVYEKLDGSLIQMYYYANAWRISTSGTPDASGPVDNSGMTFEQLFWDTWNQLNYIVPSDKYKNLTFLFELMTKHNRVVVKHEQSRIVLHGARYTDKNMDEMFPEYLASIHGWNYPQSFSLNSLEDIQKAAVILKPLESEGYVVVDERFNRIKIKSPAYVAIAHLVDKFSSRRILEILRLGEENEFEAYLKDFPEWTTTFHHTKSRWEALIEDITNNYNVIKDIDSQKEFAAQATKLEFSGALFAMRKGKLPKDYLSKLNIKNLEEMIKRYE